MIEVALRQPFVVCQKPHRFREICIEAAAMPSGFLSPIIALELAGVPAIIPLT